MCMKLDARPIKRVRTEQERQRRRKYGDAGARYASRTLAIGSEGIIGALTTVETKDNIISEILWI